MKWTADERHEHKKHLAQASYDYALKVFLEKYAHILPDNFEEMDIQKQIEWIHPDRCYDAPTRPNTFMEDGLLSSLFKPIGFHDNRMDDWVRDLEEHVRKVRGKDVHIPDSLMLDHWKIVDLAQKVEASHVRPSLLDGH